MQRSNFNETNEQFVKRKDREKKAIQRYIEKGNEKQEKELDEYKLQGATEEEKQAYFLLKDKIKNTPPISTKDLLWSDPEADRKLDQAETEIIYLTLIRASLRWKWYHTLKRAKAGYELWKMTKDLKGRLNPVGPGESILFIGTNPSIHSGLKSAWEDPFGKYFAEFLRDAGIDPTQVRATNLYKYPTPENRPLNQNEIREGFKELMLEITFNDPTLIVPMGAQARSIFEVKEYEMKDWQFIYQVYGLPHPSYVKRFPESKVEFIKGLQEIKKINDAKRIRQETLVRGKGRGGDRSSPGEGRLEERSPSDGQEVLENQPGQVVKGG